MKKAFQLAVILLAFSPVVSFGQTQAAAPVRAEAPKDAWPAMTNFHTLMSSSFHPAEEGNFAPLRANADQLFAAAKAWKNSVIPADKFKPKETKEALGNLVIDVAAVQKAVTANRTDAQLLPLINKAHDTFHRIVGECRQHD